MVDGMSCDLVVFGRQKHWCIHLNERLALFPRVPAYKRSLIPVSDRYKHCFNQLKFIRMDLLFFSTVLFKMREI